MDAVNEGFLVQLLDEHGAALVLYAQQWCNAPEDVVQEAIIRLMRQRPAPGNAIRWLYCVIRNEAVSHSRSLSRRKRYEFEPPPERNSATSRVRSETARRGRSCLRLRSQGERTHRVAVVSRKASRYSSNNPVAFPSSALPMSMTIVRLAISHAPPTFRYSSS